MSRELFKYGLYFMVLLITQVLVLNNMQISAYINPYAYILFVLILPFETPGWLLLLSAFALGLGVDLFPQGASGGGTALGFHAAASVLTAYVRPTILRWINPRDEYDVGTLPCAEDYGIRWYIVYSVILIGLHHFVLFNLEAMSILRFPETMIRTFFSLLFTLILVFVWEGIRYRIK